jgi:TonB family protein
MKRLRGREDYSRFSVDSAQVNTRGLMRAGTLSLLLHIGLVVLLTFSLKPYTPKERLSIYRVTLRPFAPSGAIQSVNPGGRSGSPPASQPTEQVKPDESSKVSKIGKKPKPEEKALEPEKGGDLQSFKKEKVYERWKKAELEAAIRSPSQKEKPKKERESKESLQEALEDVRKKIALDNIQKRVEKRTEGGRSGGGQKTAVQPPIDSSQIQGGSSSKGGPALSEGTGTGSVAGIGTGSGGYPIGGVPWGSPQGTSVGSSELTDYYDMIWAKIKKEWILPGDILKGKTDLETIIVIIIERDGKIKKSWFEKRSGNVLYDQSAMRAIKKADPLLPLPKKVSDAPFEIGIRFYPE